MRDGSSSATLSYDATSTMLHAAEPPARTPAPRHLPSVDDLDDAEVNRIVRHGAEFVEALDAQRSLAFDQGETTHHSASSGPPARPADPTTRTRR